MSTEAPEKTDQPQASIIERGISMKIVILFISIILFIILLIGLIDPSILSAGNSAETDDKGKPVLEKGEITLEVVNEFMEKHSRGRNNDDGKSIDSIAVEYVPASLEYDVTKVLGSLPFKTQEEFVNYLHETTGEEVKWLNMRWDLYQLILDYNLDELQGQAVEAFLRTPRHLFVRKKNLHRAYEDTWMPIAWGATITDPDVVAMMTTTLDVQPDSKVLEIGTGTGYQSAIISNLTNYVYSIEIIEPLFYETNALYKELAKTYPSYNNIHRKLGDGYYGWKKFAPFDRIIVTCAIDHIPPILLDQLAPNGIMVVPLGHPGRQYIMEIKKDENGEIKRRDVYNGLSVRFIPFRDDAETSYSGD